MVASDTECGYSRGLPDLEPKTAKWSTSTLPDEAVEELGLGFAQVRTLAFVGVVPFCMGAYLAGLSLVMAPLGTEFRLVERQETYLTFLVNLGILLGALSGGRVADQVGRKATIISSGYMLVAFGLLLSLSRWLFTVLFSCFALGYSMGFGFGAACAMISETTPYFWRTTMRAATDILLDLGFIFAALTASSQDQELLSISWRRLLVWVSLPCAMLGLLTTLVQLESPIFLAAKNQPREAEAEFARLAGLNGSAGPKGKLRIRIQPGAAQQGFFSHRLFNTTATLFYVAFILSLVQCAAMYFETQVHTQGNHDLVGAWQMIGGSLKEILVLLFAAWFTRYLPRTVALHVALGGSALTVWGYAFLGAGTSDSSSLGVQLLNQFTSLGFHWAPTLGIMIILQVSVEVYPATMAATGAGIVLAAGRLATILVPDLLSRCEALAGTASSFCCLSGCLCILGAGLVHMVFQPSAPEESALLAPDSERKGAAAADM